MTNPTREALAEELRQAWFYADTSYPIGKRWLAVADAAMDELGKAEVVCPECGTTIRDRAADAPDAPDGPTPEVEVDPEIRLCAVLLDLFEDVEIHTRARVLRWASSRLVDYQVLEPQ
jgi:hypothetical protein